MANKVPNLAQVTQLSNLTLTMDSLAATSEVEDFIDESLYSRQLYVLGHEAMRKMIHSNVLIIGLKGVGVEIAKNVILAGVRSVTLFDPEVVSLVDLSAQFYLTTEDIGHRRDECSCKKLAELNEYVPVRVLEGGPSSVSALEADIINKFQVVVVTDQSFADQLKINEITHPRNISFISVNLYGLFAGAFCDFGSSFVVSDATGEPPIVGMISNITKESEGVVTCIEDTRHGLEDGDFVSFREIKGMTELNGCLPRKVKVLGPYTFSIGDTTTFGDYQSGGVFEQVKQPKILQFSSLKDSTIKPEFVVSDFAKMDLQIQIHIGFQALNSFQLKHRRLPLPHNEEDAKMIIDMAKEISTSNFINVTIDSDLIKSISFNASGYLAPIAAFMGGLIAQEVLKACSGKFHPILQYFYYDAVECLPADINSLPSTEFAPIGSRYDPQIAIFGRTFVEKLGDLKGFIVGSGAIGCELMKVFALMGVGRNSSGYIHVTDMDTIEKSNLNRQFLFRPWDVSKPKSKTATEAVSAINPDIKGKFLPRMDRVGQETENIFNDTFFGPLDFVANALDNMDARKYMDRRCVFYCKPLLESGTLGTKGNTQIVVPNLTESYSSSQDPPEKTIPFCTLHNFPNAIEHTIQWSMDQFHGIFRGDPENVNLYLSQPKEYFENLNQPGQGQKDRVDKLVRCLVTERPLSFDQCVTWARLRFEEYFHNNIVQLLFNFPKDAVTSSGAPFWSGPKRAPSPIIFNPEDQLHMQFILTGANLRAENFGLKGTKDLELVKKILTSVIVPEFVPKSGVKIQVNESESTTNNNSSVQDQTSNEDIEELIQALPEPSTLVGFRLQPIEFEKDDDTNLHVDFVAAMSNLRALNYEITPAPRHVIKQIAGKIIPAIATTTAVVSGLISLELYKLAWNCRDLSRFKNGFVNLALPFFGFSEPISAPKNKYNDKEWTLWDRFNIKGDPTLAELIEYFKKEHEIVITMLSHGSSMLYGFVRSKEIIEERLRTNMTKLVTQVGKKPLPEHTSSMILEMLAEDLDGNDIEVPYILLKFK